MFIRFRKYLCVMMLSVFCITVPVSADIMLPKIFSDHMVLQRNSSVKIWGTAESRQKLVVSFNGTESSVQASPQGDWSTQIKTPEAGGPYELQIAAVDNGPKVIFSDVMVGEVWICSGQSNMEWPIESALNADTEIENAKNYPNLRLFTIGRSASPQPLDDFDSVTPWHVCSPDSIKNFSATSYFFGRELSREMKEMPIGLIHSSWGGTPCESWISRKSMDKLDSLSPLLRHWDENDDPTNANRPGNLYNGMIAPLASFNVRGAIWYQGEANNGRGHQYATLLPTLIHDWRQQFGGDEFPFYIVQIAPYRYANLPTNGLAEIWDAQLKTYRTVKNTGLAVTGDVGNELDIHPKNKQAVGRRLALLALTNVYADQLPDGNLPQISSGPIYESMSINENRIRLTFEHVGEGLLSRNETETVSGFQICGDDNVFVDAEAVIEGGTVMVSSAEIDKPISVRFCWFDTAEPELTNSAGLPAMPFRTDDLPLDSADRTF